MTNEPVHTCPRCDLRFFQLAELRDHLEADHQIAHDGLHASLAPRATMLVPLDPDRDAQAALAVAAQLASQLDLVVELLAVPGIGLRAGTEAYLQARARELRLAGVNAVRHTLVDRESAAAAILERAEDGGIDLICMASRSSNGPVRKVFGSVAKTVMSRAHVPVLVCGREMVPPTGPYREVVACWDGSDTSYHAVAIADRLRQRLGARLTLLEVIVDPSRVLPESIREGADLATVGNRLDPQPETVLIDGFSPQDAIVEQLGLLPGRIAVLGTHGRSGLSSVVLGSVAAGVVAHAPCPVLVVPPIGPIDEFLEQAARVTVG